MNKYYEVRTMGGRRSQPREWKHSSPALYNEWLEHIKDASKERLVITGKKKDADFLASMGVQNTTFYDEKDPDFVRKLPEGKEVILLFSANHPANVKCFKLRSALEANGFKVNTRFRKLLFESPFRSMSGLLGYMHNHLADTPRKHKAVQV